MEVFYVASIIKNNEIDEVMISKTFSQAAFGLVEMLIEKKYLVGAKLSERNHMFWTCYFLDKFVLKYKNLSAADPWNYNITKTSLSNVWF